MFKYPREGNVDGMNSGSGEVTNNVAVQTTYSQERDQLVLALSDALCELEGVTAGELPPIGDEVNLEALEELFHTLGSPDTSGMGEVTFRYLEYQITVHSSGQIEIYPPNNHAPTVE